MVEDPISKTHKALLLFFGFISPSVTHLIMLSNESFRHAMGFPRFQTGLIGDKLAFLLSYQSLAWMYPLIVLSMVAFVTTVADVRAAGKLAWIRFGLFTGIPLGVAYHLVFLTRLDFSWLSITVYHLVPVVVVPVILGFCRLMTWMTHDRVSAWIAGVTSAAGLLTFISTLCVITTGDHSYWSLIVMPFAVIFYSLFAYGPLLYLGSYVLTVKTLLTAVPGSRQFSLAGLLASTTWLAAFFAASRYAVLQSLKAYSQLPKTDPGDCYVANAASRGHVRIVKTTSIVGAIRVNDQLCTLKAFEIALKTLTPRSHLALRRVYDFLGPPIACQIHSRWAADLAYLSLKPFEWFARFWLRRVLGVEQTPIRRVYGK